MDTGTVGVETGSAADPLAPADCSIASLRRRAWAQSKDSLWHHSAPERPGGPQEPQHNQNKGEGDARKGPEEPGRVPNKITSWLSECRTPIGASLDEQSASPTKGPLRNGCSFEDDLSLGAEANHLQSSTSKPDPCFGLAADQKRSQFKERARSMNSTGSGKSSTVSSVSELLDLYEEDPEEVLLNLGFGREEPDVASKVPSRFLSHSSSARGIDIKVYLGAQMQRLELENPNYALTSRFRQIEVFTSVANEFFQLYSQVSGQPIHRISTRDLGGEEEGGGGGGGKDEPPPLKKTNSALNVAKRLKKTISKHNLQVGTSGSHDAATPTQQPQLNGHAHSDHTHSNGHTHTSPEQNGCGATSDHLGETGSNKHLRKKDSCVLATVTEETNGDGEMDKSPENSPEHSGTEPTANETPQTESADNPSANQTAHEEEKTRTSTPDKTLPPLVCPQLAQLRTENADSFDMEEIQSNEDDALPPRSSRNADLLRTGSQQSDSSGFAEEPSTEFNSFLKAKLQASSDSCDSENTVTSHPSQDVATPLAVDQPAFVLPTGEGEEQKGEPGGVTEADGRSRSREEEDDGNSDQFLQYTAHHLPRNRPVDLDLDEEELVQTGGPHPEPEPSQGQSSLEPVPEPSQGQFVSETKPNHAQSSSEPEPSQGQSLEPEPSQGQSVSEPEPNQGQSLEPEPSQGQSVSEPEPEQTETGTQTASDPDPLSDGPGGDGSVLPPPPPASPVLRALNRAKQYQLSRGRLQVLPDEDPQGPSTGRGRGRGGIPLQRSSSLPSSLLTPSRVVSSVRIQFGQGQSSCSQPRYSYRYTQEGGGPDEDQDKVEKKEEEEEEDEVESGRSLSTLIINPASSSRNTKPPRLPAEPLTPPKPIPRYLMRSSYSLQSSSPPPDMSHGGHAPSWSTQSVPDLSSNQHHLSSNHTHQTGFTFPAPRYLNQSPNPSPGFISSPTPFPINPPLQYPPPLQPHPHPYSSLPNLHYTQSPSLIHYPAPHHTTTPTIPQHSSLPQHNSLPHLYPHPTSSAPPHHGSLHNLHPATPIMHHQTSYHASLYASPYHGYHGYSMMTPPLGYTQYPLLGPEHGLHPGLAPPPPGFHPGLSSVFNPGSSLHQGLTSVQNQVPTTTEMQLRRVLHDIRGTVQSLGQSRSGTPDVLSEHRSVLPTHQSLAELQQKRQSLNVFRSQMMDLELSIIRQQALVYKHLSPADRMEVEQLQSLRSAVREELQELEQQLEDRLVELTKPSEHRRLRRDRSVDSLSTASALRAMEPVSDLLREQLYLQSELSYDCHAPSISPSSRSSSPVRGGGGGVYRASINITPAPPPRPNAQTEEEEEEEEGEGEMGGGGGGETEVPEEEGGAGGGARVDNLQQLIKEIRDSVAEEVRREIYSELLAAVTTRPSPVPTRPHPL